AASARRSRRCSWPWPARPPPRRRSPRSHGRSSRTGSRCSCARTPRWVSSRCRCRCEPVRASNHRRPRASPTSSSAPCCAARASGRPSSSPRATRTSGARSTPAASGDVEPAEVRGQARARHWETLLGLIAEVALEAPLPADEIEKERRLLLGQIKARADAPFSLNFDTLLRDLYGAHPYALQNLGRKETIEPLTRDDLS